MWTVLSNIIKFVTTDIWRIRLKDLPRKKSFLIKQLRTVLLAVRGFDEDKCLLRASSLTFYTLLSIVPVVAMAFGIAKGFGFENYFEKQLYENLPGQETVLLQVVDFAQKLLENTKGGMIAGIGVIILFWSVMKLLGHIESSFNEIWEIRKSRTVLRKLTDYIAIMLISPIFLVVSGSITIFITTQITQITERVSLLGMFSPLIMLGLKLLPYGLIGVLMTIIYMMMPNTKVNIKSGVIAGIVAGATYVLLQWGYINFQVGIAKYNAIYGSFAALPLFLIWLQLSWLIVLFGAEISFAIQNVDTYEFESDSLGISPGFRRLLSLQTAHQIIMTFVKKKKPLTAPQISHNLEIPIRLAHQILYELDDSRIISETNCGDSIDPGYQPAQDINRLSVRYVIDSLNQRGSDAIPVAQTRELKVLSETLREFGDIVDKSSANKLLKDI
ncbi:MAG: YihY/virulence factor BrkB family protein [Deltaproteobacteria bacterium]|nr:YihY/virulence factor BrkB family protein [Deltaproteobacteria bacterium]